MSKPNNWKITSTQAKEVAGIFYANVMKAYEAGRRDNRDRDTISEEWLARAVDEFRLRQFVEYMDALIDGER